MGKKEKKDKLSVLKGETAAASAPSSVQKKRKRSQDEPSTAANEDNEATMEKKKLKKKKKAAQAAELDGAPNGQVEVSEPAGATQVDGSQAAKKKKKKAKTAGDSGEPDNGHVAGASSEHSGGMEATDAPGKAEKKKKRKKAKADEEDGKADNGHVQVEQPELVAAKDAVPGSAEKKKKKKKAKTEQANDDSSNGQLEGKASEVAAASVEVADAPTAAPGNDDHEDGGDGQDAGFGGASDREPTSAGKSPSASRAFQRVKSEEWLGKKGSIDNSYGGTFGESGWGHKASQVLGAVRGKDFRHEKTKKKRGTYFGGKIDDTARFSFKYDSSDDE